MQFRAFEPGIEVNGQTVFSVVDGLAHFRMLSKKYLTAAGIGTVLENELKIDLEGWYDQQAWLGAFEKISDEVGDTTLFKIGFAIPRNAKFPPWVQDIDSAIRSIDIAYHMNHRKNGKELFNPESGEIGEGIGNYGFRRVEGERKIICECNNPYPCAFDKGIVTAMARKFEEEAEVVHDYDNPCRKDGAESCTYIITW